MRALPVIDDIHHYCDRCCWRCRFIHRCACAVVPAEDPERPPDATQRVTATLLRVLEHATARAQEITSSARVFLPNTPNVLEAAAEAHAQKMQRVNTDPLVSQATGYALQALPLARSIRDVIQPDRTLIEAAERLLEISGTLASKIYRAVSATFDEDFDPQAVQSDGNGSAKVARLLIEESRRAWQTLDRAGVGNGVPARLTATLDGLESGLCERFPRALEFVRPGFDTEDTGTAGQLAAAMRIRTSGPAA